MKYLSIGIGILAVILACSILYLCLLNSFVTKAADQLQLAVRSLDQDDTAGAVAAAQQAESLWRRYSGFLCSVLEHTESDAITWGLANVRSYAETQTWDEFRASCVEAEAMIRHVVDMEMPYYYNIF